MVLLASVSHDLQAAVGQFIAKCETAGMRMSTSQSEAAVLSQKRVKCPLQVGNDLFPLVWKFKHLGVCSRMRRE